MGTDAVLLGALAVHEAPQRILEVGCGTGIISMMLAQRFPSAKVSAIDIDEKATQLSTENFKNCIYADRLGSACIDFNDFKSAESFDLIVCNPPYFEANASQKDIIAKQKVALNTVQLVRNAATLLTKDGVFSVIIPTDHFEEFSRVADRKNLFLKRKIEISGIRGGAVKRVILEYSQTFFETEIDYFTIEKSPRNFSDQYLNATKDFHLFQR